MPRRNFLLPVVAFVGVVLFFCVITWLMLQRYERGDVYAPYSSLRADPLGARAFYEALDSIPGYSVSRGFSFLHRELTEKPTTLVYLGTDALDVREFSKDEVADLDDFVKNGGRIIITFSPEKAFSSFLDDDSEIKKKDSVKPSDKKDEKAKPSDKPAEVKKEEVKKDEPAKEDTKPDDEPTGPQTAEEKYERDELRKERDTAEKLGEHNERAYKYTQTLTALWGFGYDEHDEDDDKPKDKTKGDQPGYGYVAPGDKSKPEVLAERTSENGLEESVPWKSAIYFVRTEPEWTALYNAKKKPVMIWRKWGKGEIIIASDSYLVSNEALRNDRRPVLLNLLAGPPGHVLFDETHLGTEEQQGVMFLLEKFRLEGYLFGILAVLGLFLWRNSVPLVPPLSSGRSAVMGGIVSGKDSRSGLVNLLRRNIPFREILKTSMAEWKRTVTPSQRHLESKTAAMDAALASTEAKSPDDIVLLYHHLREINNPSRAPQSHATKS